MKRKCTILSSACDFGSSYKRHICVDLDNANEIYECIESKRKKWKLIVERTLTQPNLYWDSYAKEKINTQTKSVSAIKFFDPENTRIYCKEVSTPEGDFLIVCTVLLLSKKVQQNDKRIDQIIEKVEGYEYEIE